MFVIQNPVKHYKNDNLKMYIREGAEISYDVKCGEWKEVLT